MKLDFINAQCRLADIFRQSAYTKFLLDYAASEDRIHALWCEILKEEEKLLTAAKDGYTTGMTSAKKGGEGHSAGLNKAKSACDEFLKVIEQVNPQY
ncbi:hypothetical protein K443DRAFT_128823 [Laccaria amethystina LaAM-08-1]|uniref:Uncharacterized protein n=1 Tax=Laccaria amethystina LaAM-08-1 TaxID=1095629 RepID=A0A0C9Y2L0_9AGAR|nr:hypothetical protein K443DRAFT_128823 [Laccaria amethystina LaAM-08-1]